jgi:CDP-diacylglycerol--serine O-phosphatidyltransferase
VAQAAGLVALLVAVGTLMVSTVRFPSSKQKKSPLLLALVAIGVVLLFLLQWRFFVLFFLIYISVTLLMNIGWQMGWRGVPPPEVFED